MSDFITYSEVYPPTGYNTHLTWCFGRSLAGTMRPVSWFHRRRSYGIWGRSSAGSSTILSLTLPSCRRYIWYWGIKFQQPMQIILKQKLCHRDAVLWNQKQGRISKLISDKESKTRSSEKWLICIHTMAIGSQTLFQNNKPDKIQVTNVALTSTSGKKRPPSFSFNILLFPSRKGPTI